MWFQTWKKNQNLDNLFLLLFKKSVFNTTDKQEHCIYLTSVIKDLVFVPANAENKTIVIP